MKLPFDFSLKFIFRLVLPGVVLAGGVWPAAASALKAAGLTGYDESVFAALVIFLGWALVLLDMHIYMLFEGRRYWPKWLWNLGCQSERRRLAHVQAKMDGYRQGTASLRDHREASVEWRRFPLNPDSGQAEALFPTQLGNLLAAYESYPNRIYGMDAAFYWPRLWLVLDKDLKEDIDSQQSIADAALYLSASFAVCTLLGLSYAVMKFWCVEWFQFGGTSGGYLLAAAVCALLAFLLYRAGLHSQAQFGETFKAAFDLFRRKVELDDVLEHLVQTVGEPSLWTLSRREKNRAVWRYLHNYRVKRPGDERALTVGELERMKNAGGVGNE